MNPSLVAADLKARAAELGFALAGVCPARDAAGYPKLQEWLASGYAGQMHYLSNRAEAYRHPRSVLESVRSVLMLAMPYRTEEPKECQPGEGRISRYAWGPGDYHDVIHDKLHALADWLRAEVSGAECRGVVDSAPLLEREFAVAAGLGWIGKNTLLLNKPAGSYFFLAALLTNLDLPADAPFATDHCGTCRACLDACPTQAFPQPYVLDATKCISYLTIELREAIPEELRPGLGDWLFGCDVCQDVCPWNHRAPLSGELSFQPRDDENPVDLIALFELDDAGFKARFRHSPLWRSKRRGILRNAAIVLGNQQHEAAIPALIRGLNDNEPLIRGASAWALGKIGGDAARTALQARIVVEPHLEVKGEIEIAIGNAS
ncbi:tRNA epoxyqueuosine(34) reductase QueG [Anatilimnocola floriformis]|uniref:tRNA epoxyqueuosine(34) reductase QueG n=1 Tax=Anatilimnocola floriformis TaxID=2948575 RepID=UPI0020C2A07A|nr:tRNA epoxyqueuosine(34) reductase QueG [Anatilimnocola floriformis]